MAEVINMNKRTNLIFSILQGIAVIIAIVGTMIASFFAGRGYTAFCHYQIVQRYWFVVYAIIGLLTVAAVSLCSYVALFQFFTLCQRLKHGTAFTATNEKALHRIALCCGFSAAALCIAFIIALFYGGFYLAFLELLLLFIAAYLCVSLVAYALELLLRRATAIQEENDLTI